MIEIDPIKYGEYVKTLINKGSWRRAYKRRIWGTGKDREAVADMLGCNLNCSFCWVHEVAKAGAEQCKLGKYPFQPPEATFDWIASLAKANNVRVLRISGCEPLLNKEHTLKVIELTMEAGFDYVLDTNLILLDKKFLNKIQEYRSHLKIYCGLKGANPEHFTKLCGADPQYWHKQLESLKLILDYGFTLGVNLMANLTPPKMLPKLFEDLCNISPSLPYSLDMKRTIFFPHNSKRITKSGVPKFPSRLVKKRWEKILKVNQLSVNVNVGYENDLKFLIPVFWVKVMKKKQLGIVLATSLIIFVTLAVFITTSTPPVKPEPEPTARKNITVANNVPIIYGSTTATEDENTLQWRRRVAYDSGFGTVYFGHPSFLSDKLVDVHWTLTYIRYSSDSVTDFVLYVED